MVLPTQAAKAASVLFGIEALKLYRRDVEECRKPVFQTPTALCICYVSPLLYSSFLLIRHPSLHHVFTQKCKNRNDGSKETKSNEWEIISDFLRPHVSDVKDISVYCTSSEHETQCLWFESALYCQNL